MAAAAAAAAESREALKAQRHQLYCSIAETLQRTGVGECSDVLDRLQAVLEAEACLSCIDGEAAQSGSDATAEHGWMPPTAAPHWASSKQPAGSAVSALQQLKAELAQHMHHSMHQQKSVQQQHQPNKFISCSALLADLRAVQKEKASLAGRLEAAQAQAARQKKQYDHDVRVYKKAAEKAALLAQAAQGRLLQAEEQLAASTREDVLWQTQQLAEQAKCTVKLGEELRQLKQHMVQLHCSVVQPLLHWQHEQQQQQEGDAATASTSCSRDKDTSRKRSHKQWQPPAAVTPGVVEAAAAAVEKLLLQQAQQDLGSSQAALAQRSCLRQQQLQAQVSRLEAQLQDTAAALEAARQEASAAGLRAERLQQQLDACNMQHDTVEQLHEGAKHLQQQHQQELQQQVNTLLAELACVQGEAAAAQRQVALLQEGQQKAADAREERLQQLQQAADDRRSQEAAAAEQELRLQHVQALQAAQAQAQQAAEASQQAWQQQRAALEKQHLQALLRSKQVQEQERQQWQRERDELVQQLTAQYTASGMQMHQELKEQLAELQQQLQAVRQERDALLLQRQGAGQGCTQHHGLSTSWQPSSNAAAAPGPVSSSTPAFAVQFSRALQTADSDRSVAVRRALEAEKAAAELRQQMRQQEQELGHLHRALDELRSAAAAANSAAAEAEASAATASSALQEQVMTARQLQLRLDEAEERHQGELVALRRSASEQVRVIQADARSELEAAQTRLQLLRLKQQKMVQACRRADQLLV